MERLILENQVAIMRAMGLLWGAANPMLRMLSERIKATEAALAVWSPMAGDAQGGGDADG
jgi:hypothetical protein